MVQRFFLQTLWLIGGLFLLPQSLTSAGNQLLFIGIDVVNEDTSSQNQTINIIAISLVCLLILAFIILRRKNNSSR